MTKTRYLVEIRAKSNEYRNDCRHYDAVETTCDRKKKDAAVAEWRKKGYYVRVLEEEIYCGGC